MSDGSNITDLDKLLHIILINLHKKYRDGTSSRESDAEKITNSLNYIIDALDKSFIEQSKQKGGMSTNINNNDLNIITRGGKINIKNIVKNKIIYFKDFNIINKNHLILDKNKEARGRIIDNKLINNHVKVKHNNKIFDVPIDNIRFFKLKNNININLSEFKKNRIVYFKDKYIRNKQYLVLNKNKEARGRIIDNNNNIKTHVKVKHNNNIFNVPINNIRFIKIKY